MSKNFEELLKALKETEDDAAATLAKAQAPEEDAGLEDDPDPAEAGEAGEGGDDAAIQAAADAADFGKSFEFVDEKGEKHEAVDATALVKSLLERADRADDTLAKALTAMNGVVAKQGELIKSLTDQVKALSSQGRGRKAVVSIVEKPDAGTLAKSQASEEGMSTEQFFAKANAAFDAEKISGKDLNVISVCLRSNHPIEPALIQKVMSA